MFGLILAYCSRSIMLHNMIMHCDTDSNYLKKNALKRKFMRKKSRTIVITNGKIWKQSLETRAELSVLRTYVENQAKLELILLYRNQNIYKPKSRAARTVYRHIFLRFYKIIVSFFSSLFKMQTKLDQTVLY